VTSSTKVKGVVRHLERIITSPRDVLSARREIDEAEDDLADAVAELRAGGMPWSALAAELGVTQQAVGERYGCEPRAVEVARLRRRALALFGTEPRGRLTVADRLVYFSCAAHDGLPASGWLFVRRCESEEGALRLAMYLGSYVDGVRFVRRPADFPRDGAR